jgi:hypothetical protein
MWTLFHVMLHTRHSESDQPRGDGLSRSELLPACGLGSGQEGARVSALTAQFECAEIFVPLTLRYVGILSIPLRKGEEVLFGNQPLPGAVSQVGPLLARQAVPLDCRHGSTAKYQSAELINQLILVSWIVIGKVFPQLLEEQTLPLLLALKAQAHEHRNRLAHARVNGFSEVLHLARNP